MKGNSVLSKLNQERREHNAAVSVCRQEYGHAQELCERFHRQSERFLDAFIKERMAYGNIDTTLGQVIVRSKEKLQEQLKVARQEQKDKAARLKKCEQEYVDCDDISDRLDDQLQKHLSEKSQEWNKLPSTMMLMSHVEALNKDIQFHQEESSKWSSVLHGIQKDLNEMPWFDALFEKKDEGLVGFLRKISGQSHNEEVLASVSGRVRNISKNVEHSVAQKSDLEAKISASLQEYQNLGAGRQLRQDHAAALVKTGAARDQLQHARSESQTADRVLQGLLRDQDFFGHGASKQVYEAIKNFVEKSIDDIRADVEKTPSQKDDLLLQQWTDSLVEARQSTKEMEDKRKSLSVAEETLDVIDGVIQRFKSRGWSSSDYKFSSLSWPVIWTAASFDVFERSARYSPPPVSSSSSSSSSSFGGGGFSSGGGFGGGGFSTGGGF